MRFFLGTHRPNWLAHTTAPLFVSDHTLRAYKTLPIAKAAWALDSGGFTELSQHGTWATGPTPRVYADRVRRYRDEIGGLAWAAPQDWMCEPFITERTGLCDRAPALYRGGLPPPARDRPGSAVRARAAGLDQE